MTITPWAIYLITLLGDVRDAAMLSEPQWLPFRSCMSVFAST